MALKRQLQPMAAFSMSSMTDVIFLLLIFFMITSTIIFPGAIDVNLPQSSEQTTLFGANHRRRFRDLATWQKWKAPCGAYFLPRCRGFRQYAHISQWNRHIEPQRVWNPRYGLRKVRLLASTPEISVATPEEETFLEPELLRDLGEESATAKDAPAPAVKGDPKPDIKSYGEVLHLVSDIP